jgi:hypothetical protein
MPALIAWIVAAISTAFSSRIGQWCVSALVFLGLELAVNSFAVGPILDQIKAVAMGLPADALGWVAFFNLDKYITIVLSAMAVGAGKSAILRRRAA